MKVNSWGRGFTRHGVSALTAGASLFLLAVLGSVSCSDRFESDCKTTHTCSCAGSGGAVGPSASGADGGGADAGETSRGGSCDGVVCAPQAACQAQPAPHCACPAGYSDPNGDGTSCDDIDECATDNGGCDPLVKCQNTPGGFSCGVCPEGYQEDGKGGCSDVDECATDNGGCDPSVECTNTDGGRACGDCPGLSCGEMCCPSPPTNGASVCSNDNTCGVACKTNFHACSTDLTACFADTDIKHCGPNCETCSQPNAINTCSSGACSYSCGTGLALGCLYPNGRPVCSSWDFESNTVEGFAIDTAATNASDGRFMTSTKHATSGSRSLAIGYAGQGSSSAVEVKLPLCPGGQSFEFGNRTFSLDLYAETAPGTPSYGGGTGNGNFLIMKGKTGPIYGGCDSVGPAADQPFKWVCSGEGLTTGVTEISMVFRVHQPWSGTFYIDNVKLQ